jgi:hypothetical protein
MSHLLSLRRAGTALGAVSLTVALAVSLAVGVTPAHAVSPSSPAGRGATWLAGQLNKHGVMHNGAFDFDDYGLTIDTAFALEEIGGHKNDVRTIRAALSKHVTDYTTFDNAEYAGNDAKLLAFAQATGGGARHFGGTNLLTRLNDRVVATGPSAGRIEDVEDPMFPGDTANAFGQIFAARGLLDAGSSNAPSALQFLLLQQCDNGAFRLDFNAHKKAAKQGCLSGDTPDTDVTALAVIELTPVAKGHPALKDALAHAVAWLKKHQHANGSFGGAGPTSAINSNSTGLAGWAARTVGRCGMARDAAGWLGKLQVRGDIKGTPLAGDLGAIAYDHAAMKAAKKDGIDKDTRGDWRRASAQAAPALLAPSHCG